MYNRGMKKDGSGNQMENDKKTGFGKLTRREFMAGTAAAGAALFLGGIGRASEGFTVGATAEPAADAAAHVGIFKMPEGAKQIRILQFTDTHIHYVSKNIPTEPDRVKMIKQITDIIKPDMIANTGDFWATNNGGQGNTYCKWACMEFVKLNTPWAFTWGNHDESSDYEKAHAILEQAPNSMYKGALSDGNYTIEVRAADGSGPLLNLIFLNDVPNGFTDAGGVKWFENEAARIKAAYKTPPPALLFFHIPLPQYMRIPAAKDARGVMLERICHENGSEKALKAFKKSGFVRACFCGHDHTNDCYGTVEGIRLQYSRAFGGYGADKVRKGATLLTVDLSTAAIDSKSVFADGTSWTPVPFTTQRPEGTIY